MSARGFAALAGCALLVGLILAATLAIVAILGGPTGTVAGACLLFLAACSAGVLLIFQQARRSR